LSCLVGYNFIIIDPVGAGATPFRTKSAQDILNSVGVTVVKGNQGEIATLARMEEAKVVGVDSQTKLSDPGSVVRKLAKQLGTKRVVAMTGKLDYVSNGESVYEVHNNSLMLGTLTGTGTAENLFGKIRKILKMLLM